MARPDGADEPPSGPFPVNAGLPEGKGRRVVVELVNPRDAASGPDGAIAAIDCGTNSTRLLIADRAGKTLVREMRITRLGAGVDADGVLAGDSIDRCVATLEEYRALMDTHGVTRGRLVATSAVRDAANGSVFMDRARQATGIQSEILSGLEEGRTSLAGAVADLSPTDGPFLVVDIGGGSTELVVARDARDDHLDAVSLQMGCVRISERFLHSDPPTDDELIAARDEVVEQISSAVVAHPRFREGRRLVGLAGTVATLSAMNQGLPDYDRDRIHHSELTREDVRTWLDRLATMPAVSRLRFPGLDPGREDVILGGLLVLGVVMDVLGHTRCLVSESDILDGLIASQLDN